MGSKPQIVAIFEDAVVRGALICLRALPYGLNLFISILLIRGMFTFLPSRKRIAMLNLQNAFPDKTEAERARIFDGEIDNLGRLLSSMTNFESITPENFKGYIEQTHDSEFLADYERLKDSGFGRIIVGAHVGNWEILALAYPMLFEPLHFLYRKLDNPRLDNRLKQIRTQLGNKPIDKAHSANQIMRVLRNGGAVGILADVNVNLDEGVFVPFFGLSACTTKSIALLSLRARAAIIPIFAVWEKGLGTYSVVHGRIIEPESTSDIDADAARVTAAFTAEIEKVVRTYPDQWMWIHRRWKTRPPGEPGIYGK